MKITKEMVMELNNELAVKDRPFRYKYIDEEYIPKIEITLPNMNCVDSFIINVSTEFFNWLNLWFKTKYDIELNCNNTGSILWAKII